ncbi:MAG: FAD-dependent oxidoreductase [Actinomycetota bacterium]|nr:FAD-dependent oxidoreductase [Actinomycetota bacterium]
MDADVVVLGAGPAGLGAAWRAARAGHRVVVLERSSVPGGAAGSFVVGGQRVDHGSHRLHPSTDPAILKDLRVLLGGELQTRRRNGRIRLEGRWIGFPLRAGDLLRRLPASFAVAAARDAAIAPLRRARDDSFSEVLRAGLGPTICDRFYLPYARKIWGVPPEQLSGEQARRRVSAGSPAKLLRRIVEAARSRGQTFYYPAGGFGRIAERLAAAAAEAGAELRYGDAVQGLSLHADQVRVTTADGGVVTADRAWSTLPLPVLARMAVPAPPPGVLTAAGALRFRSLLLVYLVLDDDRYTPYDAHYLPEATTPVSRVSEPKNYRDGDDPPGRTVLCAEVPCDQGDDLWSSDDAGVGRLVGAGLRAVGLPEVRPVEVVVRRLSSAYPVYLRGFERQLTALEAWAASQPRLLTFGRQGLFAHDNTHHALAMAWAAADALRPGGGGFDEAAWTAARERFRGHVVED